MSRERSRCREAVLHKCRVGLLLTESVAFGDPSSFGNKPDARRTSQQLHQLPREQRPSNCKLSHTVFIFVLSIFLFLLFPHLLLLAPSRLHHIAIIFADAPHSTFDQDGNNNAVKRACVWDSWELGPVQISHRLAVTVSAALQQSWADPVTGSQTGSIPCHWHFSDTSERLFRELNQQKMNRFKHRSGFSPIKFLNHSDQPPVTAQRSRQRCNTAMEMNNYKNCCNSAPKSFDLRHIWSS